jgi:hypothetical protein
MGISPTCVLCLNKPATMLPSFLTLTYVFAKALTKKTRASKNQKKNNALWLYPVGGMHERYPYKQTKLTTGTPAANSQPK